VPSKGRAANSKLRALTRQIQGQHSRNLAGRSHREGRFEPAPKPSRCISKRGTMGVFLVPPSSLDKDNRRAQAGETGQRLKVQWDWPRQNT